MPHLNERLPVPVSSAFQSNKKWSDEWLLRLPPPHHNHFTALFPGPPGWAGARRELLDFMVQGKVNRGRPPTIWLGATPSRLTSAYLHHTPVSANKLKCISNYKIPFPKIFCNALTRKIQFFSFRKQCKLTEKKQLLLQISNNDTTTKTL